MFHNIMQKIKEYQNIVIHRHSVPDGDALGSQIGLKEAIKETFPKKNVYAVGDSSERFSFIGQLDQVDNSVYSDALVIILDSSEAKMISDERWKLGKYIIKIDHHIFKEKYADLEIVNTNEISCASIVTHLIFSTGMKLNVKGASALYTGIVTDSGRFRYGSSLKSTFNMCEKLFKYDINIQDIYNKLYVEDLDMVLLRAKMILKMQIDGNIAYLINTYKEVKEYNQPIFNISRGMVNIMSGINGIDIWANFTELENGEVLVELRSNKYNINKVAVSFGGGGHKLASGTTISSIDKVEDVLKALKEVKE